MSLHKTIKSWVAPVLEISTAPEISVKVRNIPKTLIADMSLLHTNATEGRPVWNNVSRIQQNLQYLAVV
jgi:hypothetical protein